MKVEKVQTERLDMRVAPGFLSTLDNWRAQQRPILTRSEAIRLLVLEALGNKTTRRLELNR